METKSLLIGILTFIAGGLLVSIAATTFEKDKTSDHSSMNMQHSLHDKTGDEFDKVFIDEMIIHHQGAIDMAEAAQTNAKHNEVKDLATEIIQAQNSEISKMRQWQTEWGY